MINRTIVYAEPWQLHQEHDRLSTEASILGLPPGTWPDAISVPGRYTRTTFRRQVIEHDQGGDVTFARYLAGHLVLVVWND